MSTNRLFNVMLAGALIIVIALVVYTGVATSQVMSSSPVVLDQREGPGNAASPGAAVDADVARWVAIGKVYAKWEAQRIQRVQTADAARWTAMAKAYAKQVRETQLPDNRTCVLCGGQ